MASSSESKEVSTSSNKGMQILSPQMDLAGMSLEQRATALQRWSEAQAADKVDNSLIGTELHVTDITVYQRDFVDVDTGEVKLATYTAFTFADGKSLRTASGQALPFAAAVAGMLGYDPETGHLPNPILMEIRSEKVAQGFQYKFVFKGLAKK